MILVEVVNRKDEILGAIYIWWDICFYRAGGYMDYNVSASIRLSPEAKIPTDVLISV